MFRSERFRERLRRYHWGKLQELEAESYWLAQIRAQGQQAIILERGFRVRGGEIDWIGEVSDSRSDRVIVFAESRARAGGLALESVDAKKRSRIVRAAQIYLQKSREFSPVRFDLVVRERGQWSWIPGAWDY